MSPPYADRVRLPHQPRPPAHWPEACEEREPIIMGTLRVFVCQVKGCERVHTYRRDDMDATETLYCDGKGFVIVRTEPRA